MNVFFASIGFGLVSASVLAVASVGFTLQFAVTNVLNLAYASVMTASAFVAYAFNERGVTIWLAALAAALTGAILSLFLNRVVYSPFQRRKASPIAIVIVALGMTLIIEYSTQAIAGPTNVSYRMNQGPTLSIGSFSLTVAEVAIICISLVLMAGVHLLIRFTRLGKAMRATAANRDLARSSGIRTDRVISVTWILSGALCGIAGAVFGMDAGTFGATSMDLFLVLILAAVFLGGPGEAYGAMLGALVIGLGTEVSAAFIVSDYKDVIAFVVLLAMLAVRPTGLLASRT
ncbi:MAG TPA: branched-chain amino acid ABC transporter permease [Gaiellaceae bacterium]|nr:branched-chain amino acid ABC transporter permease [Gaiellaceae bacterium]